MTVLARNIKVIKTKDINITDEFFNPLKREKHFLWKNASAKKNRLGTFEEFWNTQSYVYALYDDNKIKAIMGLYIPEDREMKSKLGISILKAARFYYEYYDHFINNAVTTAQTQGYIGVELVVASSNKYLIKKIKSSYTDVEACTYPEDGFTKMTIYVD